MHETFVGDKGTPSMEVGARTPSGNRSCGGREVCPEDNVRTVHDVPEDPGHRSPGRRRTTISVSQSRKNVKALLWIGNNDCSARVALEKREAEPRRGDGSHRGF
ncbi:hypothetical protein KM043_005976 [Ampulex compressa]|nr:hypothetical protein KM043_005976 [Ampulex compressa]